MLPPIRVSDPSMKKNMFSFLSIGWLTMVSLEMAYYNHSYTGLTGYPPQVKHGT